MSETKTIIAGTSSHYNSVSFGMNKNPNPLPPGQKTEAAARALARKYYADKEITILLSPHKDNKNGDYFLEGEIPFVRSWETVIFEGLGVNA